MPCMHQLVVIHKKYSRISPEAEMSDSVGIVLDSGSIKDMFSNCLATSNIDGHAFVLSSQNFKANDINLFKYSKE